MYIDDKALEMYEELERCNVPMTIESISSHFGILVAYNYDLSCFMFYRNYPIIYLKYDDKQSMWNEFTHELGHFALHETNQLQMNEMFNDKQENQADKFAKLFQMPQSIIEKEELFTQNALMNYFNVDSYSALGRLHLLYNYFCNERGYYNGSI